MYAFAVYAFAVYAFAVYAFAVYAFAVYAFAVYAFAVYAFAVYAFRIPDDTAVAPVGQGRRQAGVNKGNSAIFQQPESSITVC